MSLPLGLVRLGAVGLKDPNRSGTAMANTTNN